MGAFSATIRGWAGETKERMTAVRADAAQNVVAIMQTPGPSVKNPGGGAGGNMPVATGFLRSSLQAGVGYDLPPLADNPNPDGSFSYDGAEVNLTIASVPVERPVTVVYTARYARKVEERYGFVRLAVQRWPQLVDQAARDAQSRAGG